MTFHPRNLLLSAAVTLGLVSPAAAADAVTLRYLASQGGLSAHELAQELGYFDGTGITIESVGYATGGPASLIALASGDVEIGSAATSAVLNSIISGNDFVAAYPSNGINDEVQSIFYVLEDSPIKSIKDIAGKSIAVNTLGAHLDYTIREALHSVGLPTDAANQVVVPGPQLEQVLRSGQVDISAFGYWQTTFEGAARKNGGLRAIFDDTDVLGEIAGGFVVLRRDFVKEHPEAAKTFVLQSARALDYAREHPQETKDILAKALKARGENPEIAQYFRGYGVRAGGLPVERDLQFWIDVLVREGKLKQGQLAPRDVLLAVDGATASN
ncbi:MULTISPECIES: ABC transporter substrate-binding protein [Ensifer]|jgi:ABC-type nitrate/sulfonate/bicarbonate transport system substrate-binding protein|uniref:ABC transporter substrate-binding protein n=1 Tax=Ensifer adhaerens TaxID=106592 RepID=A0A9Q9DCR8_ENSAD|nr:MULTISPECIES: ABC transporter substrate-binding protein [Ensifer]KSV64346.1 sulfonate ABC transporter substrate-binding protein [Sinorhizobium sp. GL2]KSV70558.1 sulfonate ABC transporter substrate-binding protein [Sinorhizobium sp. GW3]ANK75125.1 sulfonate ABC transporter substrate-binding protein [Ensifer adhaerens]KDP75926.1 sulfonate ABC transporter substrate-binding protein [Ensifer adhaerens]KQX31680.1 sulfonate ABC transporter substrate-binding protein [Ensifer sp. Root423]